MGVSGSGKTTVAVALAARLGWPFQEGDALHPAANVAKMRVGPRAHGRGPVALARRGGGLDRCPARGRRAGDHHLLGVAARLSRADHAARRAAGVSAPSRARCWPPAWPRGRAITCRPACWTASSQRLRNPPPTSTRCGWTRPSPPRRAWRPSSSRSVSRHAEPSQALPRDRRGAILSVGVGGGRAPRQPGQVRKEAAATSYRPGCCPAPTRPTRTAAHASHGRSHRGA